MKIYLVVAVYIDLSCQNDREYPIKAFKNEDEAQLYVQKLNAIERKAMKHVKEVSRRYDIKHNTFQRSFIAKYSFPDSISIDVIELI